MPVVMKTLIRVLLITQLVLMLVKILPLRSHARGRLVEMDMKIQLVARPFRLMNRTLLRLDLISRDIGIPEVALIFLRRQNPRIRMRLQV